MVAILAWAHGARAAEPAELGNWFNDPFFQVRSDVADCPLPMGPYAPHAEVTTEEHSRVERGTSCWLAGKCANPNAYMYDSGIATRLAQRFKESSAFQGASLWITVKRRFVWVEGCASAGLDEAALDAFVKAVPEVELVLVNVRTRADARLPYTPRPAS